MDVGDLGGFCKSRLWSNELTWYTSTPDFTPCFQNTILVWTPLALLILFSPFEIRQQLRSKRGKIPWSALSVLKYLTIMILCLLCVAEFVYIIVNSSAMDSSSAAQFSSPIFRLLAYFIAFIMTWTARKNGVQTSMTLFLFWLLHVIATTTIYYSKCIRLLHQTELLDVVLLGIYLASAPLILLQFLLCCIADKMPSSEIKLLGRHASPEPRSSYLAQLLFSWLDPLIVLGYREPLTQKKLWNLDVKYQTENITKEFDVFWDQELNKAKASGWDFTSKRKLDDKKVHRPSFLVALIKCYWPTFLVAIVLKTISDLLQFVNPQMLNLLISFISSDEPLWKGIVYAIVIFLSTELQSLFTSQYFIRMYIVAMKLRMAIIAVIYKKALKMSNQERKESTLGEIVNLMSIDTQRFVDLMPYILMLYSAPLQIVLALYFLTDVLGISVIAGVVVMILMAPLNVVVATYTRRLQVQDMKFKDERTKLMNEILNGIKVLKLYAWEIPFSKLVLNIRDKEVSVLKRMAYYMAAIGFLWTCAPVLVSLASFTMYVLIDDNNVLTANVAFVSLSLFNLLRFPLNMLPSLITSLIQVSVSVKRLNKFIRGEELDPSDITHLKLGENNVIFEKASFSWGGKHDEPVLRNINLRIKRKSLVAIVGQVGCGKSSLISAILGELGKTEGKLNTQGSIAYVPQQAWIQNASVKENILMYKKYDNDYFDEVIDACGLKPDLDILPGGIQTEIGEKGINLSGGQKQRVSLARAVYHDNEMYLLDDPLSAVDSHVGKHIFDRIIGPNGLLKSKTRVFVTNSITYLSQCDTIVTLKDGKISEIGSYKELLSRKGAFAEFLVQHLTEGTEELSDDDIEQIDEIISSVPVSPEVRRQLSQLKSGSESEGGKSRKTSDFPSLKLRSESIMSRTKSVRIERSLSKKSTIKREDKNQLIQTEKMETAEVKIGVYVAYLQKIGMTTGISILLLWCMAQGFSIGGNVWLSEWSKDPAPVNDTVDLALRDLRLGIYGGFGIGQGLCTLIGGFGMAYGSMRASTILHSRMLDCVMRSPMSFFDTTPIGRIVNRFSKDINVMDVNIVMNFRGWIVTFLQVLSTILVDAIETPIILVVMLPAGLIYYFVQRVYIATSRQLKRLESVSRSPIYVHFSESVSGASSIRAYGVEDVFIRESNKRVDNNMISYYPSVVANRWLAVRLEFVGNIIVMSAALFVVLGRETLDPGSVGLSVSYAMSITASLNWMVRMSSELETNIVSVERIIDYSELKGEADWNNEYNSSRPSWPDQGHISFNSYATRYREGMDLVLRGISCDINPKEKIGICGRTGAGKSSLTLALFRIIEAVDGCIKIDGVNISKLGLHDLRSKLTIIPQDPVLFSGDLRQNLDPFDMHTDDEIWNALEHAHLREFVSGLNERLNHIITEGGENLSVGQRQLICLARALLRKTKVLVLDEATAAVDLETDDLIQQTIRKEFNDCTILTIAHRLNTIMDSTRVMVLHQGTISEFDTPQNLLQDKSTIFYGMAKDAGLIQNLI